MSLLEKIYIRFCNLDIKRIFRMTWALQPFIVIVLVIVAAVFAFVSYKAPVPSDLPIQTAQIDTASQDKYMAKTMARQFMEASLKAPSTAKWQSYSDTAAAPYKDKKGKLQKDVWDVVGWVDSQNSYGAMLRTSWIVTVKKNGEQWQLVGIYTY